MSSVLNGKVVLITGAARGIGEHTARLAAARGARLALVGLEPERLAALAGELGDQHAWFECDVTDQASLDRAVRGTIEALGRIDVVVANAGIVNRGTIAVGGIEPMIRTVDVNLLGVMRTVGATVEHVLASRGYFLLVSSAAAFTVLPGMAAYCASKAGVEQFGNAIRLELAHRGVAVGTAHPGWVDTDLVRDAQDDLPAFREARARLPWPLRSDTSVEACAAAFVDGIERRRRRVYVPRAVGLVQALRTITTGPIADRIIGRAARRDVPQMEEQVRRLGRGFGTNTATGTNDRKES
ncbi:SDR family oxidoreductase [Planosporangium mesophilum]|uniref:Oxidoreductase n=1 Tax=Planosporangium mesophilum TaxID=689768 RepID=A0A8J3TGU3_9ACTN|nr:SDR family oxidoreductase [Planosporangium mesophilum]NJC85084.1 SDR family oxidoreductase [Planosporangium mesophilum]GII24464.1 oxidoreductase [Planosporangium mesophilum]